jgi:hypothetical protein
MLWPKARDKINDDQEQGYVNMKPGILWLFAGLVMISGQSVAGEADVVDVEAVRSSAGTYDFHVSVKHDDAGWDHYANVWQVLAPDGTMLGERVLLHPHENEQPFRRSLTGVSIPDGIDSVTVRAGDKVHEFGGAEMVIKLPGR